MQNLIVTYCIKSLRESVKFSYGRENLNEFESIYWMLYIYQNHVLACHVAKLQNFLKLQNTEAAIWRSVNNCFENVRGTMKGLLLKSLKNTSEQVHFYEHCRPVNCTLIEKWVSLLEFFKSFLITRTFRGPFKRLLLNPATPAARKIMFMKLIVLRLTLIGL